MRILIASTHTIPAFSGGWTTPLDLLGNDHQAMYVIRNYPAVRRTVEGIMVVGTGTVGPFKSRWNYFERYRFSAVKKYFKYVLEREFHRFKADFILCLDPEAALVTLTTGLPYAMRFHAPLDPGLGKDLLAEVLNNALFSTASPRTYIPGVEVLPHNQDLTRFKFRDHPSAERAILLTSLNPFREPDLFIEGIMSSKEMKGDIVGAGNLRKSIGSMCRKTGGRVRLLPPVPRLQVPELLKNYQIGVATIKKRPVHYQMKVNAYMASGLFTLAKPWTHIAVEAPELVRTFITPEELAEQLDWTRENWSETLETRRAAKQWVYDNYSVDSARKRFNQILEETFSSRKS